MLIDAEMVARRMHNNDSLEFDIENFDGIVIYVIAGSHSKFKGIGTGSETIVRGMFDQISSEFAVIDGITCISHEFAHCAFGWQHTIAGRNCLMNPNQTKDINCPSHPNPILKLREGWVTPIHLSSNLNSIELQPVETSKQVGIITIYGNPSAAPDHLSGECYVVENRKRLGFDKKLLTDNPISSPYKGGLLIWHYGPYGEFNFPPGLDLELHSYKLITPNDIAPNDIYQNSGNQEYFFAYQNSLQNPSFYNLLQNRTYSQENLKTGIQIQNIHQADYSNVNSNIIFNLSYNISLPPNYDYTVINFSPQAQNNLVSTSGRIYFHKENRYDYFRLFPGAKIDIAPNSEFTAKGVKATGEELNKIIFSCPGYENIYESFYCKFNGMRINSNFNTFNEVDAVVFKHVHFTNINDNKVKIGMQYCVNCEKYLVEIENITTDNPCIRDNPCTMQSSYDISLIGALINKVNINGVSLKLALLITTPQCNINVFNTYAGIFGINKFTSNANFVFYDCDLYGSNSQLLKDDSYSNWPGLNVYGGGINFNQVTIKDAQYGLILNNLMNELKITNCTFDNKYLDLSVDNYKFNKIPGNGLIFNNIFNPTNDNTPQHIGVSNSKYILIDHNSFPNVKSTGITLLNCNMPNVINNTIESSSSGLVGIASYLSGGTYHCNNISDCYYGLEYINSNPILYQNVIHNNGIGMYITNNTYPIMSPAYTGNQTENLAGYNHFYGNSGQEIYILNTETATSNLLMDDGINIIEDDDNNDYLIYIENEGSSESEIIKCTNNYWGNIGDPGYKLFPIDYFCYNPFLISIPAPPTNCQITTINEDNSSKSQQTLLLGNALISSLTGNYITAANYSEQLITSSSDRAFQKTGSRLYYSYIYSDGSGVATLPSYYQNLININNNDSLLQKYYNGLKIESQVINEELQNALFELDVIIANASNSYELLYANLDKLRILSMLDSSSGGDNSNSIISIPELYNLLKSDLSKISNKSMMNSKQEMTKIKSSNSKFDYLLKRIPKNLEDLNNKSNNQLKEIMKDKMMYEILINNYIPNVPPIRSEEYKSKNKNGSNNSIPAKYELSQNHPNPFNPTTSIMYSIPKDGFVSLKIYDITGREIKTLVNEIKKAGYYSITLNASELSTGIYFYRVQTGNFFQTKRMVLIK